MGNALDGSGAVAKDGKEELAALAEVVEPSAKGDGLAFVLANGGDGSHLRWGRRHLRWGGGGLRGRGGWVIGHRVPQRAWMAGQIKDSACGAWGLSRQGQVVEQFPK